MNGCAKKGDLTTLNGSVWSDADSQWYLKAKTPSGSNRQLIFRDESFTYSDQSWNPLWELAFTNVRNVLFSEWGTGTSSGLDLGFTLHNGDQIYISPNIANSKLFVIYRKADGTNLFYKGVALV